MGRPNTWQGEPTELLLKEGLDHTEQSYYTSTWREASRGWAGWAGVCREREEGEGKKGEGRVGGRDREEG